MVSIYYCDKGLDVQARLRINLRATLIFSEDGQTSCNTIKII